MGSNGVRLILIVLGVALLVAIYLWDRFTRRSKGKAPRKLKRKPRERREPGVAGPAPDIDDADEWRVPPEPVEDEPPVAQPEPAKERAAVIAPLLRASFKSCNASTWLTCRT